MRHALVMALRAQGIEVITAIEAKMIGRKDEEHLNYATQQGCVLYSFNRGDFYHLHTLYLIQGKSHAGIILANQQQYTVSEEVRRLRKLTSLLSTNDMIERVEFLSAWG